MYYLLIYHYSDQTVSLEWLSYTDYTKREVIAHAHEQRIMLGSGCEFIEIAECDVSKFDIVS